VCFYMYIHIYTRIYQMFIELPYDLFFAKVNADPKMESLDAEFFLTVSPPYVYICVRTYVYTNTYTYISNDYRAAF